MKKLDYKLRTLIIKKIASNFRKKISVARKVQVKHLTYMYDYSYDDLFSALIKSYFACKK